jgi:hypothetical protein
MEYDFSLNGYKLLSPMLMSAASESLKLLHPIPHVHGRLSTREWVSGQWVGGEWAIIGQFILSGEKSLYFIFTFYRQEVLSI